MINTQAIKAKDRLIVAVDVSNKDEAFKLIDELHEQVGMFKVGLELFSACGTELLDELSRQKISIFFDGKFHDIPNTVQSASRAIAQYGTVAMFNVHAPGGGKMISAAVEGASEGAREHGRQRPVVIAVTVLTSIDESILKSELGISESVETLVERLALLTRKSGADGVVASAKEVPAIRRALGDDFLIVTPGIRPEWSAGDDQKRIVTPKRAIEMGSSYIVVGRPITRAKDRKDAARRIVEEMES